MALLTQNDEYRRTATGRLSVSGRHRPPNSACSMRCRRRRNRAAATVPQSLAAITTARQQPEAGRRVRLHRARDGRAGRSDSDVAKAVDRPRRLATQALRGASVRCAAAPGSGPEPEATWSRRCRVLHRPDRPRPRARQSSAATTRSAAGCRCCPVAQNNPVLISEPSVAEPRRGGGLARRIVARRRAGERDWTIVARSRLVVARLQTAAIRGAAAQGRPRRSRPANHHVHRRAAHHLVQRRRHHEGRWTPAT